MDRFNRLVVLETRRIGQLRNVGSVNAVRRHVEAGVVLRQIGLGQVPVGRRPRGDPGWPQRGGKTALQRVGHAPR